LRGPHLEANWECLSLVELVYRLQNHIVCLKMIYKSFVITCGEGSNST
jgi:hypothetical protein